MWKILTLVLIFTVFVHLVRRRGLPLQLTGPGASPKDPQIARSFQHIDDHMASLRCPCGGHVRGFGEGTETHDGKELRVIRVCCESCEREHPIYFLLTH